MNGEIREEASGQIFIGTDEQGGSLFLREDDNLPAVIAAGSYSQRQEMLRRLARSAAGAGGAVLATDAEGRLSGLARSHPCTLWDVHGRTGLPMRTTVTELGPTLLAWLLGLNEKQSDLLQLMFRIADENGLLLIDTRDLKALLNELTGNGETYAETYGTIHRQTAAAVLNAVVALETKGAQDYLFEPALDIMDLLTQAQPGVGRIHLLDAETQEDEPVLYACLLLYLMGELYENLPDRDTDAEETKAAARADTGSPEAVGDNGRRLTILIDESQLLFTSLPASLTRKLRRMLEGLPEKGVAVRFLMPDMADLPREMEETIGQVLVAAGAGEISVTDGTGKALSAQERTALNTSDPLHEKYKIPFDRDSAYEFLKRRGIAAAPQEAQTADDETAEEETDGAAGAEQIQRSEQDSTEQDSTGQEQSTEQEGTANETLQQMSKRAKSSAKSLGNTVAGTVGRKIGKSIGSSFGDFGETLGGNIGASLGRGIINTLFKS